MEKPTGPPYVGEKHHLSRLGQWSMLIPERNLIEMGITGYFPEQEVESLGLKSVGPVWIDVLPMKKHAIQITGFSDVYYAG